MSQRIGGRDVEVTLRSGLRVVFEEVNLNLDDGMAASTDQGYPNGWVLGEVKGDGDIKVDTDTLNTLVEEAEAHGSWEEMPAFDVMTFYANVAGVEHRVEVHGVKLRFPDWSLDGKGGEKTMHTINYLVTGRDFVHVNGVPLAKRRP